MLEEQEQGVLVFFLADVDQLLDDVVAVLVEVVLVGAEVILVDEVLNVHLIEVLGFLTRDLNRVEVRGVSYWSGAENASRED